MGNISKIKYHSDDYSSLFEKLDDENDWFRWIGRIKL